MKVTRLMVSILVLVATPVAYPLDVVAVQADCFDGRSTDVTPDLSALGSVTWQDEGEIDQFEEDSRVSLDIQGVRSLVRDKSGSNVLVVDENFLSGTEAKLKSKVTIARSCIGSSEMTAFDDAMTRLGASGVNVGWGYRPLQDVLEVVYSGESEMIAGYLSKEVPSLKVGTSVVIERGESLPAGRLNDNPPHYGGAKIYIGPYVCSSGFSVIWGANEYSLTAGHCSAGATQNGAGQSWGTVLNALLSISNPDASLLSGDTTNYSYNSNNNTSATTVDGSTTDPAVGVTYCNFGYVSRRACASLAGTSYSYSWAGVTYSNLAYTQAACGSSGGTLSLQGDSGGPFGRETSAAQISARGLLQGTGTVASSGQTYCRAFAEKWSSIQARFPGIVVQSS